MLARHEACRILEGGLEDVFYFNNTPTTENYTLPLHDPLPVSASRPPLPASGRPFTPRLSPRSRARPPLPASGRPFTQRLPTRSEEHTSELQSRQYLVCRLLLETKKSAGAGRSEEHTSELHSP